MIPRRGFFGKLPGLLGLAVLPVQVKIEAESKIQGTGQGKVKLFEMYAGFIVGLASHPEYTYQCVQDCLPTDAKVLEVWAHPRHADTFIVKLESSVWDEVGHGEPIPFVKPPMFRLTAGEGQ